MASCVFPPDEAIQIQKQLQSWISKGQVYLNYSADEVSFVIRDSEYSRRSDAEKAKLVSGIEMQVLEFLRNHQDIKQVKIYFLGQGAAAIKMPYICDIEFNACRNDKA